MRYVDAHGKQSCVLSVYRAHDGDMNEKFISFWNAKDLVNFGNLPSSFSSLILVMQH